MAAIYPEAGPAPGCQSDAERKLYYCLREQLGAEYDVLHSIKWNAVATNGRMQPGEADFIIVHPTHGILVLEVKGGRIRYNRAADRWYTIDRSDSMAQIRDPFNQAMSSARVLERKLREVAYTRPFAAQYRIAYGVWFPDIDWERGVGGEMRLIDEQVLDMQDMQSPETSLLRLFRFAQGSVPQEPLSPAARAALLRLLAPELTPILSPILKRIDNERVIFGRLTDEQTAMISTLLHSHRRLAIWGHAGTGKTVIAIELSWRLAEQGTDVLFVCPNTMLADSLRRRLRREHHAVNTKLRILSLKELLQDLLVLAPALEAADIDLATPVGHQRWAQVCESILDRVGQHDPSMMYDAIVVDEAQDIDAPVWPQLHRMLRRSDDPEVADAAQFFAFYDPMQRLMPGPWEPWCMCLPVHATPLTVNCRNTGAVFALMQQLNPRLQDIPFVGPHGAPVELRDVSPIPCKFSRAGCYLSTVGRCAERVDPAWHYSRSDPRHYRAERQSDPVEQERPTNTGRVSIALVERRTAA